MLFVTFHDMIVFLTSFFPERMLLLSFTENGEVPTIFLVMTLFGERIQLEFLPNYFHGLNTM